MLMVKTRLSMYDYTAFERMYNKKLKKLKSTDTRWRKSPYPIRARKVMRWRHGLTVWRGSVM